MREAHVWRLPAEFLASVPPAPVELLYYCSPTAIYIFSDAMFPNAAPLELLLCNSSQCNSLQCNIQCNSLQVTMQAIHQALHKVHEKIKCNAPGGSLVCSKSSVQAVCRNTVQFSASRHSSGRQCLSVQQKCSAGSAQ